MLHAASFRDAIETALVLWPDFYLTLRRKPTPPSPARASPELNLCE
jgi:hypothetical protein